MSVSRTEGVQNRLNTSFTVTYPEFPGFKLTPQSATIIQEERSHDILVLRYQLSGNWYNRALKTGTPVKMTWKNSAKAKGSFFGHVVNVKRTKAAQYDQELEVRCVATSFPLKQTASNMWKNKTAPEVAQAIGKITKMKVVVSPHQMRFSQLAQFGTSYWQFLQELAFKVGFACYVKDGVIYFVDLDRVIDKTMGSIPLMLYSAVPMDQYMPPFHSFIEKTLDKFEPMLGDFIEDQDQPSRATKHITGVDPITGKIYDSTSTPAKARNVRSNSAQVVFQDNSSFDVANSKMAADSLTKGKSQRARFHMPAKFSGQGDPRLRPYGLMEVSGVDTTNDGYWMVREVTHYIDKRGMYTCQGVCVSDGRGENLETSRRTKKGASIPVLNLTNLNDGDSLSLSPEPVLDRNVFSYSEDSSGYEIKPRKWKV